MKKKIILTSVLSIVMCLSLICGATFALFTDTDTVNVAVTSGKVDVTAKVNQESIRVISRGDTAWRTDKAFANGGQADFSDANTVALQLVTPGDAVLFAIEIENLSNVAIRYRTALKVVEGDKLFEALNVYVATTEAEVKAAMAAEDKTAYKQSGVLFDGASRVSPWSDKLDPVGEDKDSKVISTVYVLIEFPYLSTSQNEYMDLATKIAYTIEAVQGNASEEDLDMITVRGITPVYTLTDLRLVAANVAGGKTYAGETVALMGDMDLSDVAWTPIGTQGHPFKGTFTSYNETAGGATTYGLRAAAPTVYTIKNLKVDAANGGMAGLIGYLGEGGTVSNIKVEGATIIGDTTGKNDNAGVIVANAHAKTLIENCHVVDATITGHDYMGGIVGSTYGAVKNCSVEDIELIATPYALADGKFDGGTKVGGVIGFIQSDAGAYEVTDNSAKNVFITAYRDFGGFAGALLSAKTIVSGNTVENVKLVADRTADYCEENKALNAGFGVGRVKEAAPHTAEVSGTTVLEIKGTSTPVEFDGNAELILNGATIVATEGNAVTLGANFTGKVTVKGTNLLMGATAGSGIYAAGNAVISGTEGSALTVVGNGGAEVKNSGIGGNGIYAKGDVTVTGIADLHAEGWGEAGFGIGGTNVTLTDTHVSYARGGYAQQAILAGNYGKNEPQGAPAIGSMTDGAKIVLNNVTAAKIEGGSKSAGIGARYWTGVEISIIDSTLDLVIGGNSSAAIGGSRIDSANDTVTVTVTNSTITAEGGEKGAGIGSGYCVDCFSTAEGKAPKNIVKIDATSVINAQGGMYAAGIGGGYHAGNVEVTIAEGAIVNAKSGKKFYAAKYWSAQDIGYGVVDPARDVDNLGYIGITCAEHFLQLGEALKYTDKIVLLADIDLSGKNWTPLVLSGKDFTLDGNGYTIKGMTVADNAFGGLIGKNNGADMTFKNITFTNVSLTGTNADGEVGAGVILGWYEDHSKSTVVIENCHVIGMNVTDYKYTGGFVGYTSNGGGSMTVKDCSVKNAVLNATYEEEGTPKGHIGGFVGRVDATTITGCTTENVVINTARADRAGALAGTVTDATRYNESNNDVSGVTINVQPAKITITPTTDASAITWAANTIYYVSGDFNGATVVLVIPKALDGVVIDGSNATNIAELQVSVADGNPGNYNNNVKDQAKTGSYTVKSFNISTMKMALRGYNTTLTASNNTVEYLYVYGGNATVTVSGNTVNANQTKHSFTGISDGVSDYGVLLNIYDYSLTFTDNTVSNAAGHVVGINGWQATTRCTTNNNEIVAFSGNTITVNSTIKAERAALKIWDDAVYAPTASQSTMTDAAKALVNTIVAAEAGNTFILVEDTFDQYYFQFYSASVQDWKVIA